MNAERKIAFITGATSGIGAEFARAFARQNYDLIITGRREQVINALASELKAAYAINVKVILAELSDEKTIERLADKIKNLPNLEVLVNNAGFGSRGYFYAGDIAVYENMLKTHVLATMKFSHAALSNMIAHKNGVIINVSSVAGFMAWSPVYSATKAFINMFTESLHLQLKANGIKFQALCPGYTISDFHKKINIDIHEECKKFKIKPMSPEQVVSISLKYLKKGRVICIPGFLNKLAVALLTIKRFFN